MTNLFFVLVPIDDAWLCDGCHSAFSSFLQGNVYQVHGLYQWTWGSPVAVCERCADLTLPVYSEEELDLLVALLNAGEPHAHG